MISSRTRSATMRNTEASSKKAEPKKKVAVVVIVEDDDRSVVSEDSVLPPNIWLPNCDDNE